MKLYKIAKGTAGKLITQLPGVDPQVQDWNTTKDLEFTETLLDPIRLHNNRADYDHTSLAVKLVMKGYALYGGEDGYDPNAKYILAVPYDNVDVLA